MRLQGPCEPVVIHPHGGIGRRNDKLVCIMNVPTQTACPCLDFPRGFKRAVDQLAEKLVIVMLFDLPKRPFLDEAEHKGGIHLVDIEIAHGKLRRPKAPVDGVIPARPFIDANDLARTFDAAKNKGAGKT